MPANPVPQPQIPAHLEVTSPSPDLGGEVEFGTKEVKYWNGPLLLRILLVLSSMSPLFVLWAIRGTTLMPGWLFTLGCLGFFAGTNLFVWYVIVRAQMRGSRRTLLVGTASDRRQDIISFLFAMLLPFYSVDMNTWRNAAATLAAFFIVVVLFTSLNLHYMNLLVAIFGYHLLEVSNPDSDHPEGTLRSFMVITKRPAIRPGTRLRCFEISPTVLLEETE